MIGVRPCRSSASASTRSSGASTSRIVNRLRSPAMKPKAVASRNLCAISALARSPNRAQFDTIGFLQAALIRTGNVATPHSAYRACQSRKNDMAMLLRICCRRAALTADNIDGRVMRLNVSLRAEMADVLSEGSDIPLDADCRRRVKRQGRQAEAYGTQFRASHNAPRSVRLAGLFRSSINSGTSCIRFAADGV